MPLNGLIYKCTNIKNNKTYIGLTTRAFEIRKKEHLNDCKKTYSKYFQNALTKNGINNFVWEIIDTSSDLDELCQKEKYWIKFYKSNIRKYGYNLTDGGQNGSPNITTRRKISKKMVGEKNVNFKNVPENVKQAMILLAKNFSLTEIKQKVFDEFNYVLSESKIAKIFKEKNIDYTEADYRTYWKQIRIQRKINKEQIIQERLDGASISQLEKKYNVSRQTVNKYLENLENKTFVTLPQKMYNKNKQEIIDMYKNGESIRSIALKYNFNIMTLFNKLKKDGIHK